jgi:hypothetical protein
MRLALLLRWLALLWYVVNIVTNTVYRIVACVMCDVGTVLRLYRSVQQCRSAVVSIIIVTVQLLVVI